MVSLDVNGKNYKVDVSPDMPLLWVIRDYLKLTGTKYGCGIGQCGVCTVHIDEKAERSCQIPVKDGQGKKITTIEGIADNHPLKIAWIEKDVPQCGYCQPGQIMEALVLLKEKPKPNDSDIDNAMNGVICRCGTYQRIRQAIHDAAKMIAEGGKI
jgi:aerobic-type carbon monoxide dehydrogenase small subunit (CoxS/CutS family)